MTDALELVNHQHAALQELAAPLGAALTSGGHVDEAAVDRLTAAMSTHDAVERSYVFPLVAARLGRAHLVRAIDAHGKESRMLSEIERRRHDDPQRLALLESVVEEVQHHVFYEQTLLSLLRTKMAAEELERVGSAMEAAMPRAPTRPHPHLAGSGGGARLSARMLAPFDRLRDRLQRRPRPAQPVVGPPRGIRIDLFRILEEHHRKMARMLDDLTRAAVDEVARRHLADYVTAAMSRHEAAEEIVLWPAVRRRVPGGRALADEGLRQERQGRFYLDTLHAMHDAPARQNLAAELLGVTREHINFEEEEVWPRLRRVTTSAGRTLMGVKYRMAFRVGPTRPHPHGPDRPRGLRTIGMAGAMSDRIRDRLSRRET